MSARKIMPLEALTLDEELQPRVAIDRDLIDDYAAALVDGATFPPVVAFLQYDGTHLLADGYHRWHVHKALQVEKIAVDVHEGDRLAALRWSLGANAAHGQRRQPRDFRRAYEIAVRNSIVGATDVEGVIRVLRCSLRTAQSVTQEAREQAQRKRDAEIAAKAAEGKSLRKIASEQGVGLQVVRGVLNSQAAETTQPDTPSIAELWQAEQERAERRAKRERMSTAAAARWDAALRALRAISALPDPETMLRELDPDLDHALAPELRAAQRWINAICKGYFRER